MNKKLLAIAWMAFCVLCASMFGQNPTTSELLQKGIYLQETVGDVDGAIKVYKQIMQMARQPRANTAQAEYRLGMCLLKKGRQAEATETFQKLIREYPEQTDIVAKARPYAGSGGQAAETSSPVGHFAFTSTGAMATTRRDHHAVLLLNGKVLIVGGNRSADAELYDPRTGSFRATGAMEAPRRWDTATLLRNGNVLIAGGATCSTQPTAAGCDLASAEVYDPGTERFTSTGAMSVARSVHTATLLPDGKVLIAGGANISGVLASAELYDPLTGSFTPTGEMTQARSFHTATLLQNGKVLMVGGLTTRGGGHYAAIAELYDPATGSFSATGSMIVPRNMHTATLLPDGRVLIAGGARDNILPTPAELYDPSTGRFTTASYLATPRVGHTATLLANGRVLIAGGTNNVRGPDTSFTYLATAELYDPSTGSFTTAGTMSYPRTHHSATLLSSGKVLVTGGMVPPEGALATAELYTFVNIG